MNEHSYPVFCKFQLETTIVILNLFVGGEGKWGSPDSLKNKIEKMTIFPQKSIYSIYNVYRYKALHSLLGDSWAPETQPRISATECLWDEGVQSSPGVGFVSGCGGSCIDRPLRANTADYLFSSFIWTEAMDKQIRMCFLSTELKRASGDKMPQCWPQARLKKSSQRRIHYSDAVTWDEAGQPIVCPIPTGKNQILVCESCFIDGHSPETD